MHVAKDRVVSLEVELSDIWGNLIERSDEPVQYLHGGYGDIFARVEEALEGKAPNDRIEVRLEPEDAFGDYDETLLRVEPRSAFPETLEVGMRFEGIIGRPDEQPGEDDAARADGEVLGAADDDDENPDDDDDHIYTVTDIADGKVILDGNHPLSGMALQFVSRVVAVRPATPAEIENGAADDTASVVMRPMP